MGAVSEILRNSLNCHNGLTAALGGRTKKGFFIVYLIENDINLAHFEVDKNNIRPQTTGERISTKILFKDRRGKTWLRGIGRTSTNICKSDEVILVIKSSIICLPTH